jgi:hypothetical protein
VLLGYPTNCPTHHLSSKKDQGEHRPVSHRIGLVVVRPVLLPRRLPDPPQHQQGQGSNEQQVGQPQRSPSVAGREPQAIAFTLEIAKGFFNLHAMAVERHNLRGFQMV